VTTCADLQAFVLSSKIVVCETQSDGQTIVSTHAPHLFAIDHVSWCDIMYALQSSYACKHHKSNVLIRQVMTHLLLAGQRWKGMQRSSHSVQSAQCTSHHGLECMGLLMVVTVPGQKLSHSLVMHTRHPGSGQM